jgi:hypothetical protein
MSVNAETQIGILRGYPASPHDYVEQAKRELQDDRKGYILAQIALGTRDQFGFKVAAFEALRVLDKTNEEHTLVPPLDENLAQRIGDFLKDVVDTTRVLDSPITTFLLASAVDQGRVQVPIYPPTSYHLPNPANGDRLG